MKFRRSFCFFIFAVIISVLFSGCKKHDDAVGQEVLSGSLGSGVDVGDKRLDYKSVELDNGLRVVTLEDFSCPIVSVQVWYHVGSKNESAERQGFAHMFEHMMFRGTELLGPTDHFDLVRRVGGSCNAYTSFDRTVYFETLASDYVELGLWLEAERMAFLKIDQSNFDMERRVVEEERRQGLNSPYGTVFEQVAGEMFTEYPYRWTPIGKISHLRASSVGELRGFWNKYYVPSNATLIIAGAVKHEDGQKLAEKYFGWIGNYPEPAGVEINEPALVGRKVTIEERNAPVGGVGIAFRTVGLSDDDAVVFDVIAEILGGGHSSRLYRELVAEKQIAMMAEAYSWSLEKSGLFGVAAGLLPGVSDVNEVLGVLEGHVRSLASEPVSAQELLKAKNQLIKSVVVDNLKVESKARVLGSAVVDCNDLSRANSQIEEIRNVTGADIKRVAGKYLELSHGLKVEVKQAEGKSAKMKDLAAEESSEITAIAEVNSPAPGRTGTKRPAWFKRPVVKADVSSYDITPDYASRVLDNGLKIKVVSNSEVPFVTVQLGLLAGAWTESKAGTCAMTMKMLTKGTASHSEGELADLMENSAISISGIGAMDTASVNMNCLTEYVEDGLGLMSEVVLEPVFDSEEFGLLKKQAATSLSVKMADPEYLVEKQFKRALYGDGHCYSRTVEGEVNDIESLSSSDLSQWWGRYAVPGKSVLIFAGDIDADRAFELAEKYFGSWSGESWEHARPGAVKEVGGVRIYLVDTPGSSQSQIRVGCGGIVRRDEDYFVSRVVSNYFGWGFNSRLNKSVRVEKGLTYGIWGSYIARRFAGEFSIGTFSKTERTTEAVEAVLEEIERLVGVGPSEDELVRSRDYIVGSFVPSRETPQASASDLWLIESNELDDDYLERLLKGVNGTSGDACSRLVSRTIDREDMVIVVVGDAAKLSGSLGNLGKLEILR